MGIVKFLFAGTFVAGTAVAAAAQDQEPKYGGSAVFAIPSDPSSFLRNVSSLPVDGVLGCIMSQGLVEVNADAEVVPLLARSIDVSSDALTYTFLLQDARWHDGQPLTSEDVRYTLEEVSGRYSAIFRSALESIKAIETPSASEVVIRLNEPYGPLLHSLTCMQGAGIVPSHIFADAGVDVPDNPAATAPIGTGPYRFVEWVRGSHVRMERNPDYWEEGRPYLDELIAQVIPTAPGRAQALLSGQIDRIPWPAMDVSTYPLIEANPSTELFPPSMPPGLNWMFLNVERAPLNDKRVRQALFMALDRDYIREAAYRNIANLGLMPFPARLTWVADESIDYREMYPFDVERANALLDEAGLPRGPDGTRFKVSFIYRNNFGGGAETAAAVRSMWGDVGVDVEILAMEAAASTQKVYVDGDFDVFFASYNSQGDPALGLARAFQTDSIGIPNGNAARYSNPEVDALFDAAVRAPSREESAEIYRQIQRILAEELPALTIVEQVNYDALATDLEGLEGDYHHAHWRNAWLNR